MQAVVQVGSYQYRVSEGDTIDTNLLQEQEGKDIALDKILLYVNKEDIRVGRPYLNDVKVTAKIVKHFVGEKLVAFKFRRRKNYARKKGHRQKMTALNIIKISA